MKNYFKILIFTIPLLLTSCQQDGTVFSNKESSQNSEYTVIKLNTSEIQKNSILTKKLTGIKKKFTKNNTQKDAVYSSEYDFTVDTDRATYIENADASYHSYTFPVFRTEDNGLFENLILSLQADGSYKALLIKYNVTEEEKNNLVNGIAVDLAGKLSYTLIEDEAFTDRVFNKTITEDEIVITVTEECCLEGNHPGGQDEGINCPAHGYCTTTYIISGGGGTADGNSPPDGTDNTETTDSGNTGGGSETTSNEDPNVTAPVCTDNCPDNDEFIEEAEQVFQDSTFINSPKAKCVYDELHNLNNTYFKNVIDNFFGSSKVSRVQLFVKNESGFEARTRIIGSSTQHNITITLDATFVQTASLLQIARTLIHEIIHAELLSRSLQQNIIETTPSSNGEKIRFINPAGSFIEINDSDGIEFNELIFAYINTSNRNPQWNHNLFNDLTFRQEIKNNIEDFHNLFNDPNLINAINSNPFDDITNLDQIYEALSWSGLEGTDDYIAKPVEEKNLLNSIENFTAANSTKNCLDVI